MHARSSVRPIEQKLATWDLLACRAGFGNWDKVKDGTEAIPFNSEVLKTVTAALKKAGYRSAGSYANLAKLRHIRGEGSITQATALRLRDYNRSSVRGIGAPKKCPGFPYESLREIPQDPLTPRGEPIHEDGPAQGDDEPEAEASPGYMEASSNEAGR